MNRKLEKKLPIESAEQILESVIEDDYGKTLPIIKHAIETILWDYKRQKRKADSMMDNLKAVLEEIENE